MDVQDVTNKDYLLIIDGSSLLTTQFFGNLPKEIMFAKTPEEKERFFPKIMQTSDGVYTNAVYGFVRVLLKIIKDQKPTHLAVAWDVSRNTFRREIYPDYKGNRGETLAPLKNQFMLCQEVLKDMGVMQFMDQRYEADDFSGSLCTKFENDLPIRIMTKDNDYLQLISDKTNLWLIHSTAKKTDELYEKYGLTKKEINAPDRTFVFTPELVEEEFGIKPSSVPSLKGIQGDSSDNIKGVPGVGEATATALIREYETVDQLYNTIRDLDDAGKKQISEFWKTLGIKRTPINALLKTSETELVGEKAAKLSTLLATIKKDIEIDTTLDELAIHINQEQAQKRFDELEFKSLKVASFFKEDAKTDAQGFASLEEDAANPFADGFQDETNLFDTESDAADSKAGKKGSKSTAKKGTDKASSKASDDVNTASMKSFPPLVDTLKQYNYQLKEEEIVSALTYVTKQEEAEQIFTSMLEQMNKLKEAELKHIGLSVIAEDKAAYAVTITYAKDKVFCFLISDELPMEYMHKQLAVLNENQITIAVLGLKRQLPYLACNEKSPMFDCSVAAYLINPNINSYAYDQVAKDYLSLELQTPKELMGKQNYSELKVFNEEAFKKAVSYDSYIAFFSYEILRTRLIEMDMKELFDTIEMPLIYTLYDMEQRGIRVNVEALHEYGAQLASSIKKLEDEIYTAVGENFNINSPKQLGVILFEKLKLPFGKKTKTGYSTSADVLEKLKLEDPVVEKILEYRQLTKLKSTYADGLADYVAADGRIHGTFNQTITATGRISSTEPNLQNIPIRMELGRQIRKVFIPEDGYVFLDADYSQIELRVLAHMSGDEKLIEAYQKKQDIHRLTASQVFHIPFDEVTSAQRSNAKAVNFGIVYGISSFSLGEDLNISRAEAEEYITKYFATYPNVKSYLDSMVADGRETGYVATLFHRLRPVPNLSHSNFNVRSAEERIAMNSPIQGTAADIIKIAMIHVNDCLKKGNYKSRLLLQIHDELLVEAHESEVEAVSELIQREMENAVQLLVPMVAEVNMGKNWYEAK